MRNALTGVWATLVLCGTTVLAGELPQYHGSAGDAHHFDRVITVRAGARWVNVMSGETVKFVDAASGRSFVWRFDIPNLATFDLVAVAPRGVLTPDRLTVYVAQNVRNTDDP